MNQDKIIELTIFHKNALKEIQRLEAQNIALQAQNKVLMEAVEEISKSPYKDSDTKSLYDWALNYSKEALKKCEEIDSSTSSENEND